MTSDRAGCRRGVAADFELTRNQALHAFRIEDHDQVNGFHANLRSEAAAAYCEERRCAPAMGSAARGDSFALFCSDDEAALQHVRDNGYTASALEYFLRNSLVGSGKDFMQHLRRIIHAVDGVLAGSAGP